MSSPESNFAAADRLLFKYVNISGHKIHAPETALGPEKAARSYQETIKNVLQLETGQLPRFDLILLGMGQDGHTASLFPGHELLQEKHKWVAPVFAAPKPPLERITLTLPVINQTREVIFVVTGAEKASALCSVFSNRDPGPGGCRQPWSIQDTDVCSGSWMRLPPNCWCRRRHEPERAHTKGQRPGR